jgi:hypothetical protein
LDGIPVAVKDTMDMAGLPTTAGWSLLYKEKGGANLMPAADSAVVARLRAAGAVILGKTNVPILSHTGSHANDSWAGPTYNAAGRGFVPGGSSAGTATAVAASMAILGLKPQESLALIMMRYYLRSRFAMPLLDRPCGKTWPWCQSNDWLKWVVEVPKRL